jgi:ABC-2 type transport system permease protein
MSILLGMSIGGIYMIIYRAFFVLITAFLIFKVPFTFVNPFYAVLSFFITLFALYGLGMAFSSLYLLWGREAWHLSNLFQEPVYAVSGLYFPVRTLGFWIAFFASIIPLTLGLDSMRQAFFGEKARGFLPIEMEVFILVFLSIIFLFLAWFSLKKMEILARREGTLVERWQ